MPETLPEGWEKGYWIEEYLCGCSADVSTRAEALGYCALHGADRRHLHRVPPAPKYGPKRTGAKGEGNAERD